MVVRRAIESSAGRAATVPNLTAAQIKKLLAFRGYGNPNGRFWFVGMEEGGTSDVTSLQIRADNFGSLADLAESHSHFPTHDMSKLTTSTWGLMSSIVGRISEDSDWWSTEYRRNYQSRRLGRLNGDTYLTEILPLPKKAFNDWPHGELFESPNAYRKTVLPNRLKQLSSDYSNASPKPEFVFCYGKSFWPEHRDGFDFINFQPALNGAIELGRNEQSVFILTKFFDYGRMGFSKDFVDELCTLIT
jgi:hypothetical protein